MRGLNRRGFLGAVAGGIPLVGAGLPGRGALASQAAGVDAWRGAFPALDQRINGRPLAYLDSAATTLRPRSVIDAIARYDAHDNANPGAALHALARRSADRLAAARAQIAAFLGAADGNEIVLTRGTTEAINLVATSWGEANLTSGDEIVLTIAEHYSNLLPWQRLARKVGARLVVVDVTADGRLEPARVREAMTGRTRLLTFTHVSNVLGLVNPAADLCALARGRNVRVFVDAAQSAPHLPIDVAALGCDFLACSSHKMLGPMGLGVLWARAELLESMPPYHVGSNMAHDVTDESVAFERGALKFQAGTPNVSGPVGLAAALDELTRVGLGAIGRHDEALVTHARDRLSSIPGVRVLGTLERAAPRVPVFTFVKDGVAPASMMRALDQEGIAVRAGDMAALPLLRRFGVETAVRASAYLYTTVDELDRLADVVQAVR